MKSKYSLLFFTFLLISQLAFGQNTFEKEIKTFEKEDSLNFPAKGQILLVGSSTIRLWKTWKEDMKDYACINRGFGGSQMSDLNYFFDRIVAKYEPKTIFLYEGDNDLAAGESPDSVVKDFREFVVKIKEKLPKTKVVYYSIRPSLARIANLEKQQNVNAQIKKICKKTKRFYFLETAKLYFDEGGKLLQDVFVSDKLHMNEKGYQIWTEATLKFLKR
jgi:lysophospholipase L1-like esterase